MIILKTLTLLKVIQLNEIIYYYKQIPLTTNKKTVYPNNHITKARHNILLMHTTIIYLHASGRRLYYIFKYIDMMGQNVK